MVACGCREVQKARGGVHLIASHEMVVNLPHSLVHGSLLDDAAAKIQVVCHNGLQAAGSVRHEDRPVCSCCMSICNSISI